MHYINQLGHKYNTYPVGSSPQNLIVSQFKTLLDTCPDLVSSSSSFMLSGSSFSASLLLNLKVCGPIFTNLSPVCLALSALTTTQTALFANAAVELSSSLDFSYIAVYHILITISLVVVSMYTGVHLHHNQPDYAVRIAQAALVG